jgi:hypothetical protein
MTNKPSPSSPSRIWRRIQLGGIAILLFAIIVLWRLHLAPTASLTETEMPPLPADAKVIAVAPPDANESAPAQETVPESSGPTLADQLARIESATGDQRDPESERIASAWGTETQPALAAFTQWAQTYTSAPADEKQQLVEQGVELAQARRQVLYELILNDPERALAAAVPMSLRDQFPPEILTQLEERVSGKGDIARVFPVNEDGDPNQPFRYADVNGVHYVAYTYGNRDVLAAVRGASIHGIAVDVYLAVLDSGVRKLEVGENVTGRVINETCPVSGRVTTTMGSGKVERREDAPVEIANQLVGTCVPSHERLLAEAMRQNEMEAEASFSNKDGLTIRDIQEMARLHIMGYGGASGTAWPGMPPVNIATGTKSILVMLVQPSGWSAAPWSQTYARDVMIGNNCPSGNCYGQPTRTVANQMFDFSYGKFNITRVDVTPNMVLPKTRDQYIADYWGPILNDSKAAAAARGYNIADYQGFVIAHANLNWGATAWGGDGNVWMNGNFSAGILVHELGHVCWLPHANGWTITDNNTWSPGRSHVEYMDCSDHMGRGAGGVNNHYNSFFKYFMGWYPQSGILNVTSSGTYRIFQHDQRTVNLANRFGLLIRRDSLSHYFVSFRGNSSAGNFGSSAQIHEVQNNKTDTHVLDFNSPNSDNCNGGLNVNQSYTDSTANLTIRTVAIGGTAPNKWLDFQVTFGSSGTTNRRYEAVNFAGYFIRHLNSRGRIDQNPPLADSQYREVAGLNGVAGTVSLESVSVPGRFLRARSNGEVWLDLNDNTSTFRTEATWRKRAGLSNASASSFESYSLAGQYLRHRNFLLYREAPGGGTADATFWTR